MMQETATPAYTALARALHWFTAALIMIIIPLGLVIYFDLGGKLGDRIYDLHRSIGALVIPIVLVRIAYRLFHKPARLSDDISYLQRFMAHTTHWTLYALITLQPFIGWIATSASRARRSRCLPCSSCRRSGRNSTTSRSACSLSTL